ncbi:MAG: hypothetical protein LC745_10370, partial [Planctomycetia bacterium]|nr:hypothetical protein [Planctomycetia bacterium]
PAVLRFLIEFRADGWGYALAVWSFYRFRGLTRGAYRFFELGALTGLATLVCPKLTVLAPILALVDPLLGSESWRQALRQWVAYLTGLAFAAGLFALYLGSQRIDPAWMFDLVVRYLAIHNASEDFGNGLLARLFDLRGLSLVVLAGVAGLVFDLARRRTRPGSYETALTLWLVTQALLVTAPHKQYFAPWYLFASGYFVHLGQGWPDRLRWVRGLFLVAACVVTAFMAIQTAQPWSLENEVGEQCRMIRWMNKVARPDDRVVAFLPLHPVDRFDTFYVCFNTLNSHGVDAERILSRLPRYQGHVTASGFRHELEAHPPAFVLVSGRHLYVPFPPGQVRALQDFVRARRYRDARVGSYRVLLRPDRFDQARRAGLIDEGLPDGP